MNRPYTVIVLIGIVMTSHVGRAMTPSDWTSVHENGYQYLDPRPASDYVARETRLLLRFAQHSPADLVNLSSFIEVVGEKSGLHAGETTIATDANTVVFMPVSPFAANEIVEVRLSPRFDRPANLPVAAIQYQFYVERPAHAPLDSVTVAPLTMFQEVTRPVIETSGVAVSGADRAFIMANGVSVPSDFPDVLITTNRDPAPGYIYTAYNQDTPYALILDNVGAPVWYRRGSDAEDFKVQKNGMITEAQYRGYDQNFNWIKDFHAVNGYHTDDHELQVLEDGGYLLLGLRVIHNVDMSRIVDGGHPNATVNETCIQEFTAADELIFQWRAWDHLDIADVGPAQIENVRASSIRFSHMNAIDVDDDGHLLVSSRHLHEVTKIHRQTGQIIWRLGGRHSDFTFVNDPLQGFWGQHDVRALGNHRYTLFDNGNHHDPPVSRAVEYELDLDPNRMCATLVWEYRADPDRYTYHKGNAQRLPNGNTLINFVSSEFPMVTEVNPEGQIEFEMDFLDGGGNAYRVFRFPWTGRLERPYLVVESHFDTLTLIFNKFGDPNVSRYRVYGGLDPHPETLMATSDTTLIHLDTLENDRRYYFRVTSLDLDGTESAFSNEETVLTYFYDPNEPGENMVGNGDFSQGQSDWTWHVTESANAQWTVEDGRAHLAIRDGGNERASVRLIQGGLKLVQGETYTLQFEAGAPAQRLIEVKVNKKNVGSFWNYSKMGPVYLDTNRQGMVMKHFAHTFMMNGPTDLDGCIEINVGSDDTDVTIDNVSLVRQAH